MATALQLLNATTPAAPTRALGMLLGASGVTHPPVQTIGIMTGTSSADGSFSDSSGYGQISYDSAGYMYVADTANNRVQRFAKSAAGVWAYESKFTGVGTVLGGGTAPAIVAIDRSTTPNQVHIAAYDHYTASNWISVWSVADWPSLTTLNRLRQYGANASSNTAGRAYLGGALALDDTYAVVSSLLSPFRLLTWDHVTGSLVIEETQTAPQAFATDGADNWYSVTNGGAEIGLHSFNVQTMASISRLDSTGNNSPRRDRFGVSNAGNPSYHSGRLYLRDYLGRVMGWEVDGDYVDDFIFAGALGASNAISGNSSAGATSNPLTSKVGIVVDADGVAWFVAWSFNADNAATQSFLTAWPMFASTAQWTKTDWSAQANTLQGIHFDGVNLSSEKYKVRLNKNGGSWVTLVAGQFTGAAFTSAIAALGTFAAGATLTVELSLSTWDRLDGHASLTATRDKLSPSEVVAALAYDDPALDPVAAETPDGNPAPEESYTPTSVLARATTRVMYALTQLTPTLAPSVLFLEHTDTTTRLEDLTDPDGRIRRIEVKSESPSYGNLSWGSTKSSLKRILKIRVGYPAADYYPEADDEEVDGDRYRTEDLKLDDFRQISYQLEANRCFGDFDADHPTISNVEIVRLSGERDEARGRVRTILYGLEVVETYT